MNKIYNNVQPPGAKGNHVNIHDPAIGDVISIYFTIYSYYQGGNANEPRDDGGSSWKSSLFFVRS